MGVRKIPLINRVAAGRPGEFGDLDYPRGVGDAYVEAPAVEGGEAPDMPGEAAVCSFALKVSGDSMSPTYGEGEIVFVGTGEARDGDDCVVRMGETQGYATTFKRVYFVREAGGEVTGVRLVPLNPAYGEWVVSLEEVSGIYPVVYRLVPVRGAKGKGEGREGLSLEHD
jgi:phage repressor protein C with HTH and peptisase S24 domain